MVLERAKEDRIAEVYYPVKITKGIADKIAQNWLMKGLKATDLNTAAIIEESYLLYIPFWRFIAQGKAVACGFSEYTEKNGNVIRNNYEELIDEEYVWTKCACDTGKHGIKELWLDPGHESPYVPGSIPVMDAGGSATDAIEEARNNIRERMTNKASKRIDSITLDKSFLIPKVFELVYAPVWITHYTYKGGNYTVLVDGIKGDVIGGTSPINMNARTRLMIISFGVGGIMIGATIGLLINSEKFVVSQMVQFIVLLIGVAICMIAYPAFRTGKRVTSEGTMEKINQLRPALRIPKELVDSDVLSHKNTVLQCPKCGNILERPWGELVSPCEKCGVLLDMDSAKAEIVPHKVVKPNLLSQAAMNSDPEYIPFWCFDTSIKVNDYLAIGDVETGLPDIQGRRFYYICAADIPRYISEPWEIDLTIRNPEMTDTEELVKDSMPIQINQKTARELVEFLYLRYETEKPGVLQVLRYDFQVYSTKIVYLPYYKEEGRYIPGV